MVSVVITQNYNIKTAIKENLDYLDLSFMEGKIVAIKPNETWASPSDISAVTQADTLQAVIQQIKKYRPAKIIVSGGAGAAETEDVFRYTGIMDVIREESVEFFDHNRPPFKTIELEYEPEKDFIGPQKTVVINPRILEYEVLISLSQLKVHNTATVTLAMKNIAMSFPAADYYGHPRVSMKRRHHFFEDMHSFILAMNKKFNISLAITAGHPVMIGTGPIGGRTIETGLVIASTDAVAADVAGAKLLGFKVQAVQYLWKAAKINLGETDINKMDFPALSLKEAQNRFNEAVYGKE